MEKVEQGLLRLLKDKDPKVIAIKGPWGIGKTYFWNKFVESKRRELASPNTLEAYSYVSLFGLRDALDVKRAVFAKHQRLEGDWTDEKTFKRIAPFLKKKGAWFGNFVGSSNAPYLGSIGMFSELIEESCIKKFLICFDGLDRKEDTLKMKSFLGLVSSLKLEKNCRVVVILNDDVVEGEMLTALCTKNTGKRSSTRRFRISLRWTRI